MSDTRSLGEQTPPPDPRWQDNPMPPEPKAQRVAPGDAKLHRIKVLGNVAAALILIVAAMTGVTAWLLWQARGLLEDMLAGEIDPALGYSDLLGWLDLVEDVDWIYLGALVLAAIVFITWLWRARSNSEVLSSGQHARARGWVIGAWIVPFVNFVFPFQVVRDVWRASNPQTRGTEGELSRAGGLGVLGWWWGFTLGGWIIARVAIRIGSEPDDFDQWKTSIILFTVSSAMQIIGAVLILILIRQINRWQQPSIEFGQTGLTPPQ